MKWRFECVVDYVNEQPSSVSGTTWHVFIEGLKEPTELLSCKEALDVCGLPEGHEARRYIRYLFCGTHDRVVFFPYEPIDLDPAIVKNAGEGFVDRIALLPECCQVPNKGRTWVHYPGDSVR